MKIIKKSIIIMFLAMLSLVSVGFSLDMSSDQTDNLRDFYYQSSGNYNIRNIAGSVNNEIEFPDSNTTYTYDLDYEYTHINEDFYYIINNYIVNSTLTLMWRGDLTQDPTIYIQNFTMNEVGEYYFKFSPDFSDEGGKIYIGFTEDSFTGTIEYIEQKPMGFNSLMSGVMTSFLDIVEINISMWKIAFYTLLFMLGVIFVIGLFAGAFFIFKTSEKIRNQKSLFRNGEDRK